MIMMKKVSIFLGCACFLSLFILQPAYAQWFGFSNPYDFGASNYGYPYSGFTQPNYGYSGNQPYSYGWNQPYSYGWNQPYSYGWNQPYSYGWNQPSYAIPIPMNIRILIIGIGILYMATNMSLLDTAILMYMPRRSLEGI